MLTCSATYFKVYVSTLESSYLTIQMLYVVDTDPHVNQNCVHTFLLTAAMSLQPYFTADP